MNYRLDKSSVLLYNCFRNIEKEKSNVDTNEGRKGQNLHVEREDDVGPRQAQVNTGFCPIPGDLRHEERLRPTGRNGTR